MEKFFHAVAIFATYAVMAFGFAGNHQFELPCSLPVSKNDLSFGCRLDRHLKKKQSENRLPTFSDIKKVQKVAEFLVKQVRRKVVDRR